ncbi:MAG: 8-amino-7-oxononanoate synthase [Gammaproteobacteria bacterium]|nr:8-amino-7-oxononanoate synthase [Gammaproteobacteria bacterium]
MQFELENLEKNNLLRTRNILASPQDVEVIYNNKHYLSFTSNDYLGLANHPLLKQTCKTAIDQFGIGSGGSQLLGGHGIAHHALAEELAEFLGYERVLLFANGYMANLGVLTTLCDKNTLILLDHDNHASLIDGARFSNAHFERYQHQNTSDLTKRIRQTKAQNKLICSDGVFSMSGEIAPVAELAKIATEHNAWLMLDDAHGIGVLGKNGKGTLELLGISSKQVPILIGTFGKAFGTYGAFVAASKSIIEYLLQFCRTYIYTTALPQLLAEATRTSLKIIQQEPWRRKQLALLINYLQTKAKQFSLNLAPSNTPIQTLTVGDVLQAKKLATNLQQAGIMVGLIRPPTVAKNSSRLRISLSANHTIKHLDILLQNLAQLIYAKI